MGDHAHHEHEHQHAHAHGVGGAAPGRGARWRLSIALGLTATFMVVEVVAGLLSGSLALLSDAGHMLTDAGALGLAIWAQALGTRPRSSAKTFGYRRAEILAAAANGIVLGVTAVAVIIEAIRRFASSHPVEGGPMLVVALAGLLVNVLSALVLSRGASAHDMNMRAAAAHVLADAAGSLAAAVAAVLILTRGWTIADPITSIAISGLILFGSWRLLRDTTNVLMEGTPPGFDVGALERLVRETPGVREVHDLHVSSIVGDAPVITAHVVVSDGAHGVEVARVVGRRIDCEFHGAHVTIQPEARPPGLLPVEALTRGRRG